MSHSFLKGLEAAVQALWQRLGFAGTEACRANGVVRLYLQTGQLPRQLPLPGAVFLHNSNRRGLLVA